MYKLCKTEQSATRQRQLELGLMEAMTQQHYDEICVSDLCDQMQIPRKSFYRYFSGKEGALKALIDHTLLQYEGISHMPGENEEYTQTQLEGFFRFWFERKTLLDALSRSGLAGVLVERAIVHTLSDFTIVAHFRYKTEKNVVEQTTMFAVCGLMSMILRWHEEDFVTPIEEMATIAVQIMTRPLYKI